MPAMQLILATVLASLAFQAAPPPGGTPPAGTAPRGAPPSRSPQAPPTDPTTAPAPRMAPGQPGAPGAPAAPQRGGAPVPGRGAAGAAPTPIQNPVPGIEPPPNADGTIDAPPPLEAEPHVLDFGFIAPREKASGAFKLWNRGKNTVKIVAVSPSCKCTTTSDLTDKEVKPGEFIELATELEAASSPQPRKATIKILAENYNQVKEIEIRGEVAYPLRALPNTLNVVNGQPQKGRLVIESIDKKPFRICNIHGKPAEYIGFDPEKDEPRATYLVKWDMESFAGGKIPPYWLVETDRADCTLLPVRVRHESTIPDPKGFRLKEFAINLGRMEVNKPSETEVLLEDPGEQIITVAAVSEDARAELIRTEMVDGMMHVKIRVTPKKDFQGMLAFPIALYTPTRDVEITSFGLVRTPSGGCNAP